MNIMQVQKALQSLDDNALKQEMLSPGMAPQFLVLTEMQRRQEIRKGGRPSQIPQSTMKDEAMQGLGSLPEAPQGPPPGMPQGMPQEAPQGPPQGFAGGGPVGFAEGGKIVVNGRVYNEDELTAEERTQLERGSAVGRFLGAGPKVLQGLYGAAVGGVPAQIAPAPAPVPPYTGPGPGDAFRQRELAIAAQRGQAPPAGAYDSPESLGYGAMPAGTVSAGAADSPESLGYGAVPGQAPPAAGLPALRGTSGLGPGSLPMYPATRTASLLESGLGANVNHKGSTARGVLGITNGMWKDYAGRLGLTDADRDSPEASRRIYETFSDDQRKLNPKATDADVYTAWAAGPGAARAFRANPDGDAYATYKGVAPELADAAFSNNSGLLRRGATNAQTLAAYKGRWDHAAGPGGQPGPSFGGEGDAPGAGVRVAPPGSGAAAVTGDSNSPTEVIDRGGDGNGFDSYRARTRGVDRFGGFEDEAKALYGDKAERTKQAGAFALLETGLGIMGSNSPRLAGAVSEGGLAGLKSYRVGLEEARRGEREGFNARLGIASARAGQDQSNDRLAATLYGTDRQADTTLRAAQLQADTSKGIATLQAGTQRDVGAANNQTQLTIANIQAEAQRLAYGRNPQKDLAEWVLTFPEGPQREAAMQAAGRYDQTGYRQEALMRQRTNDYETSLARIETRHKADPQKDILLGPEGIKKRDETRRQEIEDLNRRFSTTYPDQFGHLAGGAAPVATAANPLALPGR